MYSSEENVQILLALLKAHGVKKMILSPGTTNASFVMSAQYDSDFELYSSNDERSAAYIACGMAAESQEPVAICCTGATASRNYMPGLTEAFYRKLPIVAITTTQPIHLIGQNKDQVIDRSILPKDIAVKSVHLPIISTPEEKWEVNLKVNDALLEMKRRGNGPVHINLTTSYSLDFSVNPLPATRVIQRYFKDSVLPPLPTGTIGIFVGSHIAWNDTLANAVEIFCKQYDAVVFCDQTSNYKGAYGVPAGLIRLKNHTNKSIDLIIHIGNISATNPVPMKDVWRVNPDGALRDTFGKLKNVFEMEEAAFFEHYIQIETQAKNGQNCSAWQARHTTLQQHLWQADQAFPFSSLWIAQNMHQKIPQNSVMHFGILNSLRCWNCYMLDESITGYANTGGFGTDGGVSAFLGASFVNRKKLYFGVFGDLAFFYDMNSLGNRHVNSNVRILLANNGLGGEFKNSLNQVQKAGFGDAANEYAAAYGHFGMKSKTLVKHYAQDLGFEYLSATTKEEFLDKVDVFCNPNIGDKPILFEVFLDDHEDVAALDVLLSAGLTEQEMISRKAKQLAKKMLGKKGKQTVKKFLNT